MIENEQIENNFMSHQPDGRNTMNCDELRKKAREFAFFIRDITPVSREQSLSMTKLEEALFWAIAAIERNS